MYNKHFKKIFCILLSFLLTLTPFFENPKVFAKHNATSKQTNKTNHINPKSDDKTIKIAGNEGVVTFATIAASRGTDIKPTKKDKNLDEK